MTGPDAPFRPHQGGSYVIPKDGGTPERVEHTIQPGEPGHPNNRPVKARRAAGKSGKSAKADPSATE